MRKRGRIERWIRRQRWLQRIAGVHLVHHPRWGYGWTVPFTTWVRFEAYDYKDDWDGYRIKTRPATWQRCAPNSYHDCTATGRY